MKKFGGASTILLLLAQTFFFWMFLSSETLEQAARSGTIASADNSSVFEAAHRYAARWRHGLAGGWLLIVPGFFFTAVATWLFAPGRSAVFAIWGCGSLMLLALPLAWILTASGAKMIASDLARETTMLVTAELSAPTATGAILGLLTLVSWSAFALSGRFALVRRSWWLLLVPVPLYVVLVLARPFTFDDLIEEWLMRAARFQPVELYSLILAITSAAALVKWELARGRRTQI